MIEKKFEVVQTEDAPKAVGPYSQAIRFGDLLFCSGQIALDPKTGNMVGNSVGDQARQVMKNVQGLLGACGLEAGHIVKTTIFLTNMADFAVVNEIYASFLNEPYPARSTVAVAGLPKGALIEIECLARFPRG